MNNIETEFGFDEYIMPTTYSTMPKVGSYDAQLYPSGTYTIYKHSKKSSLRLIK